MFAAHVSSVGIAFTTFPVTSLSTAFAVVLLAIAVSTVLVEPIGYASAMLPVTVVSAALAEHAGYAPVAHSQSLPCLPPLPSPLAMPLAVPSHRRV
jgi:hypothetical protein